MSTLDTSATNKTNFTHVNRAMQIEYGYAQSLDTQPFRHRCQDTANPALRTAKLSSLSQLRSWSICASFDFGPIRYHRNPIKQPRRMPYITSCKSPTPRCFLSRRHSHSSERHCLYMFDSRHHVACDALQLYLAAVTESGNPAQNT